MDSLIYSLNATIPVFAVIVLGYFLRRSGMLNEAFLKVSNTLNFKVTLPVMLFLDMVQSDFIDAFEWKYVIFCFVATLTCILVVWGMARKMLHDKSLVGEFVQASYRSSAAILGIAFIVNICGSSGMAPLMIIGAVPLYNIFAVLILTFEGKIQGENKVHSACIEVVKNPIIIAIALGFLYSLLKLPMPKIMESSLDNVARMATPLALICIGAGFEGRKAIQMLKPACCAALIKLVIQPLIFLPIAIALGFSGEQLVAVIVMLGSPTTPSCYIMAKNMGHQGVLTSSVVVLTTILSAITITAQVFIVRFMGLL